MVDLSLNRAVKELSRFFSLYSLEELIDQNLKNNGSLISSQAGLSSGESFSGNKPAILSQLLNILVETQKGSLISRDIVKKIENINEQFEAQGQFDVYDSTVIPYFESVSFTGLPSISEIIAHSEIETDINKNYDNPTKDAPTISVYQVKTIRINPTNKSTNAVSIFMNTIPTFEWSRAVPFLNVEFQLARPNVSNGQISSLSLLKFLEGAKPIGNLKAADIVLANATSNGLSPTASGSSGIEIFTSPQTLVNAYTDQDSSFRIAPVIDIFRPFASLKSFHAEVVPAPGIMSYRTGKLNFIIHDRARLHEIADFIKPDQYNTAELLIEYGWSHPDSSSAFGAFINSLKVKEKYMVKNNNFAFTKNGEVVVDLELYTKGANELYSNNVSTDESVVRTQQEIERLQNRIKELRTRVYRQEAKYTKEVRGAQILSSASDGNAELRLSRALKLELRKALSSLGKKGLGDDAQQLRQALIDLYGKDGENGQAKLLKNSVASAINRKAEKIAGAKKTPDPFIYADTPPIQRKGNLLNEKNAHKNYVSLAKLFLIYLAEPLASTNRFDDIQLLFYTFNKNAGRVHDRNIGAFLVNIELFQRKYKDIAISRRTADLNLRDFVDFIANTFVDDISSLNYGMSALFDRSKNSETGAPKPKKKFKDATVLHSAMEKLTKEAGIEDGKFSMPVLDVYVECVPSVIDEESLEQDEVNTKTILRIHIFDKVASSYSTQGELLSAMKDDSIMTIGDVPILDESTEATLEQQQQAQDIITRAIERKLIEEIPGEQGVPKVYQIKGGPVQLKEFVANTMPSVVFGTQNSAVLDLGLKSMTDDKLSTINMIRASDAGSLTPNGAGVGGIPLRLMPAQLDMRCIGCPIIEYAQSMFIDAQTNTSVDNIYTVIGIEHNIEGSGRFSTNIKFTPLDSYGRYESLTQKIGAAIKILGEYVDDPNQQPSEITPVAF